MPLNEAILERVHRAIRQSRSTVLTASLPDNVALLPLASHLPMAPIIYFSTPKKTMEYLAVGAWHIDPIQTVHSRLCDTDAPIRCFGVSAFRPSSYNNPYWVTPFLWIEGCSGQWELHIVVDPTQSHHHHLFMDTLTHVMDAIYAPLPSPHHTRQQYTEIHHAPSLDNWNAGVTAAQTTLSNTPLEKVVLARKTRFEFPSTVHPFLLLHDIQAHDNRVYNFCIKYDTESAFIGGTPERLIEVANHRIESDAIAGTLFKDPTIPIDTLRHRLLTSQKNIQEHHHVVAFIQHKMAHLCTEWTHESAPSLIELRNLLHLVMHFKGTLRPNTTWLDGMRALHPTPAVAGVPTDLAMACIDRHEPFDRGWYAGPMGTITRHTARLVVAIRSGYVHKTSVSLMAGAGIVPDSVPQHEWNELDAKISLFKLVFSVD